MTEPPRGQRPGDRPAASDQAPPARQAAGAPASARLAPGGPATSRPSNGRPHFTGRAALVAIVLCGITLSLAYPVREYISQRRQIDQLEAQNAQIQAQRKQLQRESLLLHSRNYVAEQARDRLHMCLPTQVCYEIIGDQPRRKNSKLRAVAMPWYAKVWASVQQANARPAKPGRTVLHRPGHRGTERAHS
jgi:cell division protein FtsB